MSDDDIVKRFLKAFEWHSSPIDWCEPNYAVTSTIVEFYNTVSNSVIVLLPCLLLYLFAPFARGHSRRIQMVWSLDIVIGVCSAYFHATLSLAGQLLDEFGILWMLAASIAFWMPKSVLRKAPGKIFENREDSFEKGMLVGTIVLTIVGCFWPFINAFFLMLMSLPVVAIIVTDVIKCRDPLARGVAYNCLVLWLIAATVWLGDRFACGLWLTISLPGGHWLWHIVVAFSTYQAVVYVVYQDACSSLSLKDVRPVMRLWPSAKWKRLGIAYVTLESPSMSEINGNAAEERSKNC